MMHNLSNTNLQFVKVMNLLGDEALAKAVREGCDEDGILFLVSEENRLTLFKNNIHVLVGSPQARIAIGSYVSAGLQFSQLVKDRAPWDFKHLIKSRLGEGITLCNTANCRQDVDYGVPGNIHFGFVAREGGYKSWEIHAGASIADIVDPSHYHDPSHPDFHPYEGEMGIVDTPVGPTMNFGDDPDDHNDVHFGIYLYDKYGRRLTFAALQQELTAWLNTFKQNTPASQPVRKDIRSRYPYPVGYFNPS